MIARTPDCKIKLTISLLVSNRINTIRKCMESLKPLLTELNSELIVVDTVGEENSDGSLEIAREYADHIVRFEWCNDFAAARNAGLKLAKGEWFLYLDDDEWFEDVTPIIDFLKNDDGTYNSCLYDIRNYADLAGSTYTDATMSRMGRVTEKTVFKNKIHEYLVLFPPVKQLNCFVHHYGYVYSGNAERMTHSKRNIAPLLEMLEEEPKDLRTILQLCQEYYSIREFKKVREFCEKAMEFGLKSTSTYMGQIVVYYFHVLCKFNEVETLLKAAETFLNHPHVTELAKTMICLILQDVDSPLITEEKLLAYVDVYFKNVDVLDREPDKLLMQMIMTMKMSIADHNRIAMLQRAMQLSKTLRIWDKACSYLGRYCINGDKADAFLSACLEHAVDAALALNEMGSLCKELCPSLQKPKILTDFMRIAESVLEKEKAGNASKWHDNVHVLIKLPLKHPRITVLKMLIFEQEGRTRELPALIDEYGAQDIGTVPADDLIALCYRNKIALTPIVGKICIETWEEICTRLLKHFTGLERTELVGFLERFYHPDSPEMLYLKAASAFGVLSEGIKGSLNTADFDAVFTQYVETNAAYYRMLSPEGAFTPERCGYLAKPARAAFYLTQALMYRRQGRLELQVRSIRQALTLQESLEGLSRFIVEEIKLQQAAVPSPAEEMRLLSRKIKDSALVLINSQQWAQAKALLDNLKSITPDDTELEALYGKLPVGR